MALGIHVGIHIAVAADRAGVGGVTILLTGCLSDCTGVFMSKYAVLIYIASLFNGDLIASLGSPHITRGYCLLRTPSTADREVQFVIGAAVGTTLIACACQLGGIQTLHRRCNTALFRIQRHLRSARCPVCRIRLKARLRNIILCWIVIIEIGVGDLQILIGSSHREHHHVADSTGFIHQPLDILIDSQAALVKMIFYNVMCNYCRLIRRIVEIGIPNHLNGFPGGRFRHLPQRNLLAIHIDSKGCHPLASMSTHAHKVRPAFKPDGRLIFTALGNREYFIVVIVAGIHHIQPPAVGIGGSAVYQVHTNLKIPFFLGKIDLNEFLVAGDMDQLVLLFLGADRITEYCHSILRAPQVAIYGKLTRSIYCVHLRNLVVINSITSHSQYQISVVIIGSILGEIQIRNAKISPAHIRHSTNACTLAGGHKVAAAIRIADAHRGCLGSAAVDSEAVIPIRQTVPHVPCVVWSTESTGLQVKIQIFGGCSANRNVCTVDNHGHFTVGERTTLKTQNLCHIACSCMESRGVILYIHKPGITCRQRKTINPVLRITDCAETYPSICAFHFPCGVIMFLCIHIVIHIAIPAIAGIGGVALVGTGGFRNDRFVSMGMSTLPNRKVLHLAILHGVAIGADIGEAQILPIQPVHGGTLVVGTADEIVVHGSVLHAIHKQIDHVGAILRDPVFQPVDMFCCGIHTQSTQCNTIVPVLAADPLTEPDEPGIGSGLEQVGITSSACSLPGGQHHAAPGTGGLEFHRPGAVMPQLDCLCKAVVHIRHHAVRYGTGLPGQGIFRFAHGHQIGSVKFPAVVCGGLHRSSRDHHIPGDSGNIDAAVGINGSCNIRTIHGDLDRQVITPLRQRQSGTEAAAAEDSSLLRIRKDIFQVVGDLADGGFFAQHGRKQCFGDLIHACGIGMHPSIAHVLVKNFCCLVDAAIFQIHHLTAKVGDDLRQFRIEGGGLAHISIAVLLVGVPPGRHGHADDFRIGIPLLHFVQHDGVGLAGGSGRSISKGAVTVVGNQGLIIDIRGTQGFLIIAEIVGAQEDRDDVRFFPGGIIVQIDAAVTIPHGGLPLPGLEHRRAAPGIVHQKLQVQSIDGLLPPGVSPGNAQIVAGVIDRIASDGEVVGSIVGYSRKGGDAVAKDGNGFTAEVWFSTLPDGNIFDRRVGEAMGVGTHIGEQEILAAEPVGGGLLIGGAHIVGRHGADLRAVHVKPDHVGAIVSDSVFQAVGMERRPVDAVVSQGDAIVVAAGGGLLAHGNDAVCIALEDVAGIVIGIHIIGGEYSCAAGAIGIQERTLALPFYRPGLVMGEDNGFLQGVAGLDEDAVGGGPGIFRQGVSRLAGAGKVGAIECPAVILGLVDSLRRDNHIRSYRIDGNGTVCIGSFCNVCAAHGDGDLHAVGGSQIHGEAAAGGHDLIVAVVGGHAVQIKADGVGRCRIDGIGKQGALKGLGISVHAHFIGMHPAVTDIGVKIRHGNGAAVDIHDMRAEVLHHLLQFGIEGLDQFVRSIHTLGDIQIVDLCIGIADGDLVQHNGIGLQRSHRGGIGIGTVAVIGDQRLVIDIGGAEGILIVLEVVGTHLDADDIGRFAGIVAGIVMELDAAVHISANRTIALIEQRRTAPGVVHQQPQP